MKLLIEKVDNGYILTEPENSLGMHHIVQDKNDFEDTPEALVELLWAIVEWSGDRPNKHGQWKLDITCEKKELEEE